MDEPRDLTGATIDIDRARGACMRPWRRGLSEELDSPGERERSPGSIPGLDIWASSSVAERSLSGFPAARRVWLVEEWTPEDVMDDPSADDALTVTVYDYETQEAEARAHAERCFGRLLTGEVTG